MTESNLAPCWILSLQSCSMLGLSCSALCQRKPIGPDALMLRQAFIFSQLMLSNVMELVYPMKSFDKYQFWHENIGLSFHQVFCDDENASNSFSAGARPGTPPRCPLAGGEGAHCHSPKNVTPALGLRPRVFGPLGIKLRPTDLIPPILQDWIKHCLQHCAACDLRTRK